MPSSAPSARSTRNRCHSSVQRRACAVVRVPRRRGPGPRLSTAASAGFGDGGVAARWRRRRPFRSRSPRPSATSSANWCPTVASSSSSLGSSIAAPALTVVRTATATRDVRRGRLGHQARDASRVMAVHDVQVAVGEETLAATLRVANVAVDERADLEAPGPVLGGEPQLDGGEVRIGHRHDARSLQPGAPAAGVDGDADAGQRRRTQVDRDAVLGEVQSPGANQVLSLRNVSGNQLAGSRSTRPRGRDRRPG